MATTAKLKGTVKSIKRQEGFGFISHTATGEDYFFHRSVLENVDWEEVFEDEPVEFVPITSPRGLRASNVAVLR